MPQFIVTLIEEEQKAMTYDIVDIQEWIDNAVHNKARQCVDLIVTLFSDLQPNKISQDEKLSIVRDAVFKTAFERQKENEESHPL